MKFAKLNAMVLAAGKGERMRPLTDNCPKPLLKVNDKPLIEYTIEKIRKAGIAHLVINVSYLGNMIEHHLGDGSHYGVAIQYSREDSPLETGGGIAKALPLLCNNGKAPFLLINSDVWCDIDLASVLNAFNENMLAHLVLVKNPQHNPAGDFSLHNNLVGLLAANTQSYTYSGIAVIDPELFNLYQPASEKFPLKNLLVQAIRENKVSGQLYQGNWVDVGTPERLRSLTGH